MSASRLFHSSGVTTLTASTATDLFIHAPAQIGLIGYFAGKGSFSVNVQISHDGGTTWTTVKVVDSATTTQAKGGTASFLNVAELNIVSPGYYKLRLIDTSTAENDVRYNISETDY